LIKRNFILFLNHNLSVGILENTKYEIYPNPTKDYFTVSSSSSDVYNISVMDITGNIVNQIQYCQFNTKVDISNCPNGIYIIKVSGATISVVNKLVKN